MMDALPWLLLVLTTASRLSRCDEADEMYEINVFVQSVLATANRSALGLPDSPPVQRYAPVVDGRLPVGLQRYLERLVSVSSVADKRTLVAMLWDDTLAVDEDQEPHDVLDQLYRGRKKQKGSETPSAAARRRSNTLAAGTTDGYAANELYQTREDDSYADDF